MKKIRNICRKISMATANVFVMSLCVYAANTRCGWLLHQPPMPEEMRKFRRM